MNATEITYPDCPDAKGYAKRYYKRRAFYFGQHNSAESLILFGTWKKILLETGEAPEVRDVKKMVTEPDSAEQSARPLNKWLLGLIILIPLCSVVACSAVIFSIADQSHVDGLVLTEDEMDVIRGIRSHKERAQRSRSDRVAEMTHILSNEEPGNGKVFHSPPGT